MNNLSFPPPNLAIQLTNLEANKLSLQKESKETEIKNYKENLKSIVNTPFSSIQARSAAFMEVALKNHAVREKYEQVLLLKETYRNCAETIRNFSWKELVKERGVKMTTSQSGEEISLEKFRTIMNEAINELAILIGKEAGCQEGEFSACGTVSFNSDVDLAVTNQKSLLNSADANFYTSARGEVHTALFGGHSGPQLDTEAYIPHIAENKTLSKLSSSEAKNRFIACEKANVAFQYYVSLGSHPEEYQEAKKAYLENIRDPEHAKGMAQLFAFVEDFMSYVEGAIFKDILLQHGKISESALKKMNSEQIAKAAREAAEQDPKGYKAIFKASRENVLPRFKIVLGEKIEQVESQIEQVMKQLNFIYHSSNVEKKREYDDISFKLDELYNRKNVFYSLMNLMQDEGTNTQSEGLVTLFYEGGQIHAGAQKSAVKMIAKKDKEQKGVIKHLLAKGGGVIADFAYKNEIRKNSIPKGFEKPNPLLLSIASDEESAQRIHVFHDATRSIQPNASQIEKNKMAMKAVGHSKQAKYASRTATNCYRAIEGKIEELKGKGNPIPTHLLALKMKAKKLMNSSENLLRCMRRDFLGAEATQKFLRKVVEDEYNVKNKRGFDPFQIEAKIRKVVDLFEAGGREDGKPYEKFEKMNLMIKEMINLSLLDERDVIEKEVQNSETGLKNIYLIPKNKKLRDILQARAGFSIETVEYAHLAYLHDQALFLTCKNLGLDTLDKINRYHADMMKVNIDRENLFIENNWISKVNLSEASKLDFLKIFIGEEVTLEQAAAILKISEEEIQSLIEQNKISIKQKNNEKFVSYEQIKKLK